jgi:putative ABC transport system substrate-binding protein
MTESPSPLTMLLSRHTKRREFIAGLGSAAAWPVAVRAQQRAAPIVGFLHAGSLVHVDHEILASFHRGLGEMGYVEGRNVAIEYRWAEGQYDRLPALAADLVRSQVAVIAVLDSTAASLAAQAATQTIPIVFSIGADPVEIGLVKSLNRPGGNVTGVAGLAVEVAAKRLELMHKLLPSAALIAVLVNPTNPVYAAAHVNALEAASRVLGVRILILNATSQGDVEAAFPTLVQEKASALIITGDTFFTTHQRQIAALAASYAVPTIEQTREFAAAGGLMSYVTDYADAYHLVGTLVGRILKGEKPADLPVQQATKLELIINLKTAKALGLTIPETLLATADEVIQ